MIISHGLGYLMQEVFSLEIMSGIKELANIKKCPNGHVVNDGMKYCPKCGAEVSTIGMHFCPNCGKERQVCDNFCTHCGFPFVQPPPKEKNDDFTFFGFLWFD